MRGRKKKTDAKHKTISIRVSDEDYLIYKKNKDIRKDVISQVNDYLKLFRTI